MRTLRHTRIGGMRGGGIGRRTQVPKPQKRAAPAQVVLSMALLWLDLNNNRGSHSQNRMLNLMVDDDGWWLVWRCWWCWVWLKLVNTRTDDDNDNLDEVSHVGWHFLNFRIVE